MKDNISMLGDYIDNVNEQVVQNILAKIIEAFEQFKVIMDKNRTELEDM